MSHAYFQLLMPVNNADKHWLVACIDLQTYTIDIYDPKVKGTHPDFQEANGVCIGIIIP